MNNQNGDQLIPSCGEIAGLFLGSLVTGVAARIWEPLGFVVFVLVCVALWRTLVKVALSMVLLFATSVYLMVAMMVGAMLLGYSGQGPLTTPQGIAGMIAVILSVAGPYWLKNRREKAKKLTT